MTLCQNIGLQLYLKPLTQFILLGRQFSFAGLHFSLHFLTATKIESTKHVLALLQCSLYGIIRRPFSYIDTLDETNKLLINFKSFLSLRLTNICTVNTLLVITTIFVVEDGYFTVMTSQNITISIPGADKNLYRK